MLTPIEGEVMGDPDVDTRPARWQRQATILAGLLASAGNHGGDAWRNWCVDEAKRLEARLTGVDLVASSPTARELLDGPSLCICVPQLPARGAIFPGSKRDPDCPIHGTSRQRPHISPHPPYWVEEGYRDGTQPPGSPYLSREGEVR
jgi:hypothetical protein